MLSNNGFRTLLALVLALMASRGIAAQGQKPGVPAQVWSLQGNGNVGPDAFLGTTDSTDLRLGANGEASLYILANGQVQIGSSETPNGFDVWGDLFVGGSANVTDSLVAGAGRISGTLGVGGANPDPANYALHVNGRLRTAGINELSDQRMKRNIRRIDGALASVLALEGVKYEWRRDEHPMLNLPSGPQIGVIAQEVEEVVPEAVQTDIHGIKSVEYGHLVAVLIEAVKEQQTRIEALEQETAAMRSELASIRNLTAAR